MPKAKVERVISNDGTTKVIEVDVTERETTKVARYSLPASPKVFQDMVLSASDSDSAKKLLDYSFGEEVDEDGKDAHATTESSLGFLWRAFCTFVDRQARASVYESLAQESTMISTPEGRIDIMSFLDHKNGLTVLVRGINGYRAQVDARMLPAQALALASPSQSDEILASARKEAEKAVRYGPWRTAARKLVEDGKAKENAVTGLLEVA